VRTTGDVDRLLRAGADKVAMVTAAIERPAVIEEVAHRFGSQVLVLSIDAPPQRGPAQWDSRSPRTAVGEPPASTPSTGLGVAASWAPARSCSTPGRRRTPWRFDLEMISACGR
jgi:hypothetical protein